MPKRLYCVKPCMILKNNRTGPLCKIRFGCNEYSNCPIVQNSAYSGELIDCLSFEIRFDLTNNLNLENFSFIESIGEARRNAKF